MRAPYRYDFVGSFLRPTVLKEARKQYEQGKIKAQELREVEDVCIKQLVEKQKKAGYHFITDGEFRRTWWHMDFFWGLNGIEKATTQDGLHFHGETTRAESAKIVGKISGTNHPFVEDFKYVKQFEEEGIELQSGSHSGSRFVEVLELDVAFVVREFV